VTCQQRQIFLGDGSAAALNVVTRGEEVIVFLPGGGTIAMSARDAEVSGQRLLDAAEVARCRVPGARD